MPESRYTTPEQIEAMRQTIARAKRGKGGRAPVQRGRRAAAARVKKKELFFKIAGWVLFAAVVLPLFGALVSVHLAKSRGDIPMLLGFQLYVVDSGSMEPTLPVGAVILSRQPPHANKLQVKDIVIFKTASGSIVTHRIIEVITDEQGDVRYRTKGDNPANSPDQELLDPARVIAVFLLKIPGT